MMALPSYSYHQPGMDKKIRSECCLLSCLKFFLYMYNTVLGCCGISREGKALILAYSALLALTIMVQVAVGITAYHRAKVHQELVVSLNTSST